MKDTFIFILAVFSFVTFISCTNPPNKIEREIVTVSIPPFIDSKFTAGENQCIFDEFLFPNPRSIDPVELCKGSGLANDDSLLWVQLSVDGTVTLNSKYAANISDTQQLADRLTVLFKEREKAGAFEPGSNRIIKAVGIKIPKTATFGDLINVGAAVRNSGADPIVLLLDGHLPETTCFIKNNMLSRGVEFFFEELAFVEVGVFAVESDEFVVGAAFDDAAF